MDAGENPGSLIPLPDASLAVARQEPSRVLSEMVGDTLALARREPLFKIGEYEWCEPDYRQILLWAEQLVLMPEEVIRRLLDQRSLFRSSNGKQTTSPAFDQTVFSYGRIVKLNFDLDLLPLTAFQWVDGLEIEYLRITAEPPPSPKHYHETLKEHFRRYPNVAEEWMRTDSHSHSTSHIRSLHISLPRLRTLYCSWLLIEELDLSHLPCLEILDCSWNRLGRLDLFDVPKLKELDCSWNRLNTMDLENSHPQLLRLDCSCNHLTGIFFCEDQGLEQLVVCGNDIETLDIRSLRNLKSLDVSEQEGYGGRSYSCEIVQRPDQHF
jgi:hypothetical protein